jgi:hypothetical protein
VAGCFGEDVVKGETEAMQEGLDLGPLLPRFAGAGGRIDD